MTPTAVAALAALDWPQALKIVVKAAGYAAALTAAGTAFFLAAHPGLLARVARGAGRLAVAASVVAVLLVTASLGAQLIYLAGGDIAAARDPFLIGVVTGGPIGAAAAVRTAGLAAISLLVFGPAMRWPAAAGGAAVCASFALVGHATGEPRWALSTLLWLHLLGVAYWIGAFAPLATLARRAAPAEAGRVAEDFGRNAAWAVGGLIVAGAGLLALLLDGAGALLTTTYGNLMLAKLALAAAILTLAAFNKLRLSPRLAAGDAWAGAALRRSISLEAALVTLVLLATAAFTTLGFG